jgi:hypothetical protein
VIFIAAGSTPGGRDVMVDKILSTSLEKVTDFDTRIPRENRFDIPPLAPGDYIVLATSIILEKTRKRNIEIRAVEKSVYFFFFASRLTPRSIEDYVNTAISKLAPMATSIRYQDLFHANSQTLLEFRDANKAIFDQLGQNTMTITN